jgi:peptide deformylase
MKEIVQQENTVLRKIAKEVVVKDIPGKKIQSTLQNMREALASQDDGVAIAAPQIGVSLKIFLVSQKITGLKGIEFIAINPQIVKTSKKQVWKDGEGCLSVRWLYGEVKRYTNVTVTYYDELGEKQTRGAGGLLAHIFQHEIDHLNGILFIDKARNVVNIPPENIKK